MRRTLSLALTILILVFLLISCVKDQKIETNHYTVSIPSNWTFSTRESASPKAEGLFFENKDYTNVGMLTISESPNIPDETIKDYVSHSPSPLFEDFKVAGEIYTITFLGEQARACDFKFSIKGHPFRGTFYCFRKDGYLVRVLSAYHVPVGQSKLQKVWESFKWKTNKEGSVN